MVYIILVNWNNSSDTIACLTALQQLRDNNNPVILVDNGSTDGSMEALTTWLQAQYLEGQALETTASNALSLSFRQYQHIGKPTLYLLGLKDNAGYSTANNIGINLALQDHNCKYIWLLNNDTEPAPAALHSLVCHMENNNRLGMCGSRLVYWHDRSTIQALAGGKLNKWLGTTDNITGRAKGALASGPEAAAVESQLDYIIGASVLVRAGVIAQIGLLSEEYFLYYEDVDWSLRVKQAGYGLGFAPDSIVYHKEGASTGANDTNKTVKSKVADYYALRNRLRFMRKFYPQALPTVYAGFIVTLFKRIKRRQWERIPMLLKIICGIDVANIIKEDANGNN